MGLFDSFRPSSNFAKGIKLMCDKMEIDISESQPFSGEDQRKLYSYAVDIIDGRNGNPGISPLIVRDIYRYFASRFSSHVSELAGLNPGEQDVLLIKLFGNVDIIDLTTRIMFTSAILNGIDPNKQFNERDIQIIRREYGFRI